MSNFTRCSVARHSRAALMLGALLALPVAGCRGTWLGAERDAMIDEQINEMIYTPESSAGPEIAPPWHSLRKHTVTEHARDFHPHVSFDGKMLVFAATRNGETSDIYLKQVDGIAVERKTNHLANDAFPKFSPDGQRIAFASDRDGNWNIFILNVEDDTNTVTQVTDDRWDNLAPTWSPDGRRVCFCTRKGPGMPWVLRVKVVGSPGEMSAADLGEVVEIGPGLFPDWGVHHKIAFQQARGGGTNWFSIMTIQVNADGSVSRPTEIVSGPDFAAINPAWSSDGRLLLFATVYKSPYARASGRMFRGDDVYFCTEGGNYQTRLTNHPASDWNPVWGPGPHPRVYFVSDRDGFQNVYSVVPYLSGNEGPVETMGLDGEGGAPTRPEMGMGMGSPAQPR
ncbi:MAG: PD40 domain-containing protein [Planctomycetes bacterium]|nr:PD40 domain-containing protein [Planctomycetota bacterium]